MNSLLLIHTKKIVKRAEKISAPFTIKQELKLKIGIT
jgi:hypothetical protein